MAKARASKGLILPPRVVPNESAERRLKWLGDAEAGFVSTTPVNKVYYSVLLRALWPEGHGIPGPALTESDVRAAIDNFRARQGKGPYKDVFRRMRELQGEEGFTSIRKEGSRYQLQSLEIGQKREPRVKLSNAEWEELKQKYKYKCANCGAPEPEITLALDHKIPRLRGGSNDPGNRQPLCSQCNNIKSNTCHGCALNCRSCSWAFPEDYKLIVISDENRELTRRAAERTQTDQSALVNTVLRDYFNRLKM